MSDKMGNLGIKIPVIFLPCKNVNLGKWSVIACDQYTSQPEYWKKVEEIVGDSPSTYHLIFPEVYLEEDGKEKRIESINRTMRDYLDQKILTPLNPGFIYIDRQTDGIASRKGLIMAVDLEKYDYTKGSQTLIRATEGTVIERLPPRIKIRENAPVELPHIMLLIDDPEKTVIEPLEGKINVMEKLYDFDLMLDGKHIKGYKVDDNKMVSDILSSIEKLAQPGTFSRKYGVAPDTGVLLFAVGDGNHSLAAAKGHWENVRKTLSEDEQKDHPARFALVEVVNVHDEGLKFEPIHRVVFDIDSKQLLDEMVNHYNTNGSEAYFRTFDTMQSVVMETKKLSGKRNSHVIPFITKECYGIVAVSNPKYNLEVGTLQCFLDEFIKSHPVARIDYIHGTDAVSELGSRKGNIGFILPAMDKCELFKTVILDGALPRKTFSMGEAEEKRFYLECRKIIK